MSCAVEFCRSHTGRKENDGKTITFHHFPRDLSMKTEWMHAIPTRPNWEWNKNSLVCSKHFTPDSFLPNTQMKWRRLEEYAVPSLNLIPDKLEFVPVEMEASYVIGHTSSFLPSNNTTKAKTHSELKTEAYLAKIQEPQNKTADSLAKDTKLPNCIHTDSSKYSDIQSVTAIPVSMDLETELPCSFIPAKKQANTPTETKDLEVLKPPSIAEYNIFQTAINESKITALKKELRRVKKVSKRRLRRINTLTKQITRLNRTNDNLVHNILIKLKD